MRKPVLLSGLIAAFFLAAVSIGAGEFRFGAAAVDITPNYPIRLSGYVARKTESEGVLLALYTKVFALEEGKERALFISIDNVAVPREFRDRVAARIEKEHHIPADHIVIFSSHTHSAPCLRGGIPNIFAEDLPEDQEKRIDRYTGETEAAMIQAARTALEKLAPARLYFTKGEVGFAKNRRTAGGPVDHQLPVLIVRGEDGGLRGVLANYACHCTTLSQNKIHSDWAGVAQQEIQKSHPGAMAMISIGCGADSNPSPRGELDHVNQHGAEVAQEVTRLLSSHAIELTNRLEFHARDFDLPFDPLPSRAEWEKRAAAPGIVGYHARKNLARLDRGESLPAALPYGVQVWNFGAQLCMVFLPGEVVIDYDLALKSKFDPARLWVNGYANWVPCYIPSSRILREGGYEAEDSLWYYDRPARLSPQTESLILNAAGELIPSVFKTAQKP